MHPTHHRHGARNEIIHVALAACPLGRLLVATTCRGLCAIELGGDDDVMLNQLRQRFPNAGIDRSQNLDEVVAAVVDHIAAPSAPLSLPLDVRGTGFQRQVWDALRQIPAGQTVTYSQLAKRIHKPEAVRAVAGACAKNKLAVAIPCHRVVRSDGGLGGYRWGIERKEALLENERRNARCTAAP